MKEAAYVLRRADEIIDQYGWIKERMARPPGFLQRPTGVCVLGAIYAGAAGLPVTKRVPAIKDAIAALCEAVGTTTSLGIAQWNDWDSTVVEDVHAALQRAIITVEYEDAVTP